MATSPIQTPKDPSSVAAAGSTGVKAADDLSGFASTAYDPLIRQAAEKYGVPARLIKSVIQQESQFKPNAHSGAGASGLMQLMPGTARDLGVSNPNDPAQAIDGGTKYLAGMLAKFHGDVSLALAAYNAGPGNVIKAGNKVPPFRETQGYVRNILNTYNGTGQVAVPSGAQLQAHAGQPLPQRAGMAPGGTYPTPVAGSDYEFFGQPPKTNRVGFIAPAGASSEQLLDALIAALREQCPSLAGLNDSQLVDLAKKTNPDLQAVLDGKEPGTLLTMPEAAVVVPPGASRADIEAAMVAAARASPSGPSVAKVSDRRLLAHLLLANHGLKMALKVRPPGGAVLPMAIGNVANLHHGGWAAPTQAAAWARPHHR